MQFGCRWQQHRWRYLSDIANGILATLLSISISWAYTQSFTLNLTIANFYNVITDGGATCNGVVDDAPAFANLTGIIGTDPNVIAGRPVVVTVPPGSTCVLASCPAVSALGGFNGLFFDIPGDFTFIATGASITGVNTGSTQACAQWNGGGVNVSNGSGPDDQNGYNLPFATVSAGASCITVSPAASAANYPVGNDVMLGATGVQINSFPPNIQLFEYLTISSVNSSTGVICFTTPLANSYESTWINLGAGNCDNVSCGSNGHAYLMSKEWSHTLHYIGGTWVYWNEFRWSAKTVINESMTINDVGPNFNECWFPTFSKTATLLNTTVNNCNMEYDKQVDTFILNNSHLHHLQVQSTSNNNFIIENGSSIDANGGTVKNTVCQNSTLTSFGFSTNFGATKTFAGTNCVLTQFGVGACCNIMLLHNDGGSSGLLIMSYTGSGAVTVANFNSCVGTYTSPAGVCNNPPQFDYTPGTILTMMTTVGDSLGGYQFRITDNSFSPNTPGTPGNTSGTFTVQTSITGASLPSITNGSVQAIPDSIRNWTCTNCTGSQDAIDLSQAGAQNAPIYTYSKRTYTCANNLVNIPNSIDINSNTVSATSGPIISGNFVFLKVNVTHADTTGATPVFDPVNKFGNYPTFDQSTGAQNSFGETIDLTHVGLRTINPTTTSGAVGSDVLTAPGVGQWLGGGQTTPFTVTNLAGEPAAQCPVVTVEWQADRTTLKFP